MKITVKIKSVYGRPLIYPVCDMAKVFASFTRTKCLTKAQIEVIKALGYEVEVQTPEL